MKQKIFAILAVILVISIITVSAFATTGGGNVSSVIEQTWQSANAQIQEVVNNVIFPALSLILVIAFFVKAILVWFDYRRNHQFEWTALAILFVCLIFSLIAPQFIWQVI